MTDKPSRGQIAGAQALADMIKRSVSDAVLVESKPLFVPPPPRPPSAAEAMYRRLVHQIAEFESQLDDDDEIGARLVSAPDSSVFHIVRLEFRNPELIVFHGSNEHGKPVQLLQHVTQLNVLLTALPKETEKPRRIGFRLQGELKKAESA